MKDKKKIIFNAVFLILCFSLTLFYVFKGEDFKAVLRFIRRAGGAVWLIGLLLVTAFILCESLIIYYLMKNLKQKPKLMHCCLYSFVGFFFSLVTPTASGGQPMQLVFMGRDKLPVHISSMILLLITIAYKTVLVMIGALLLLFRPRRLMHLLRPALFWVKLGMLPAGKWRYLEPKEVRTLVQATGVTQKVAAAYIKQGRSPAHGEHRTGR